MALNVTISDPRIQPGAGSTTVDRAVRIGRNRTLRVSNYGSDRPTYVINFNVAMTAAGDIFVITAGAGTARIARIHRIVITNPGAQTAAGLVSLQLVRYITTTPSGAGSVIPGVMDFGNAADVNLNDGSASNPTWVNPATPSVGGGTNQNLLYVIPLWVPGAVADFIPREYNFGWDGRFKAPSSASTGGQQGLAFRHPGAAGATGLQGWVEYTEEPTGATATPFDMSE